MSDPYRKAKGGRLTFKGGDIATVKSIDMKKKKKKHKNKSNTDDAVSLNGNGAANLEEPSTAAGEESENIYTIDAAKKMNYEELFPVEAKKFGYDPLSKAKAVGRSVEEALDDRVKKKADRYCK